MMFDVTVVARQVVTIIQSAIDPMKQRLHALEMVNAGLVVELGELRARLTTLEAGAVIPPDAGDPPRMSLDQ
jgi:hypothetical protein